MNTNEIDQYSNWIKAADSTTVPLTGRSVHDLVKPDLALFYWFKAGLTAADAANLAIGNRERLDRDAILREAKLMFANSKKRIVAVGNECGFTAVDLATYPGHEILSGPTRWEIDTAVKRLNDLLSDGGYNHLDHDSAVSYLDVSKYDPWTAYQEYRANNGDSRGEALSAAERNRE